VIHDYDSIDSCGIGPHRLSSVGRLRRPLRGDAVRGWLSVDDRRRIRRQSNWRLCCAASHEH
jgi:hypothetical protein